MINRTIKYLIAATTLLFFSFQGHSQDTIIRYKKILIPNYINFQYAGNYGAYIIGVGYYLNKKQTLDFALGHGYTSKHKAAKRIHNIFIKGLYLPITLDLKKAWCLTPQLGIALSRQFSGGTNTFTHLPKTYPDGYYAPNAYRFHFNFGVRVRKFIGEERLIRAVDFYIETTTNDLYLSYLFKSTEVGISNIFSLALGVNLVLFNKN